jgi:carboxyl-terminal processing protease
VGTDHSFGKGTVQTMLDLDRFLYFEHHHLKPLGSLKITIQKFYRINGGTTQYKGVIPDIILPDPHSSLETGERYLDFPLPWDTVTPLAYTPWPRPLQNREQLKTVSQERVAKSGAFKVIRENLQRLKTRQEKSLQPLHIWEFRKDQQRYKDEAQKFKDLQREMVHIQVEGLAVDQKQIKGIPEKEKRIKEWHDQLKSDVYIEEVMQIMDGMEI